MVFWKLSECFLSEEVSQTLEKSEYRKVEMRLFFIAVKDNAKAWGSGWLQVDKFISLKPAWFFSAVLEGLAGTNSR